MGQVKIVNRYIYLYYAYKNIKIEFINYSEDTNQKETNNNQITVNLVVVRHSKFLLPTNYHQKNGSSSPLGNLN